MSVETLGDAYSQGWSVIVRCSYGRSKSPRSQSSRERNYRKELDIETLAWTRGGACGSRYVVVLYQPPRSVASR